MRKSPGERCLLNSLPRREISRRILTTTLFLAGALTVGGLAGLAMRDAERAVESAASARRCARDRLSGRDHGVDSLDVSRVLLHSLRRSGRRSARSCRAQSRCRLAGDAATCAPRARPRRPVRKDAGLKSPAAGPQLAEEEDESAPLPPPRPSEFGLRVHVPRRRLSALSRPGDPRRAQDGLRAGAGGGQPLLLREGLRSAAADRQGAGLCGAGDGAVRRPALPDAQSDVRL